MAVACVIVVMEGRIPVAMVGVVDGTSKSWYEFYHQFGEKM